MTWCLFRKIITLSPKEVGGVREILGDSERFGEIYRDFGRFKEILRDLERFLDSTCS